MRLVNPRTSPVRALFVLCTLLASASCSQRADNKESITGLGEPVEILRDRWGISHIYAHNEHDLFLAQGYSAARDRLFQLEIWRRQATGTMAELVGPRGLLPDIGSRLLQFRGDMKHELNQYHPHGNEIISAFVDGINAYIELTEREPARLPLEFRVLGKKPGKWTPEVVVSRHNGLFRNANHEVQYAQLVHLIGPHRVRDLFNLSPGRPPLEPDPLIELSLIGPPVLAAYRASREPLTFHPDDVLPEYRNRDPRRSKTTALAAPETQVTDDASRPHDGDLEGSNNWVISGEHTFTRSPIMANDPHRSLQLPSLRYWVHLNAPGWNVIGAGEPALPGVSVGHNERGAWGFTIFPIDQEDVFIYETDPSDPSRYRYNDGWEAMTTISESIPVKGNGAVEARLRFTRHGPVIYEDRPHHKAYALRAAWLEPGTAPYLASLRVDQATTWAEFREACRYFLTPSENMVWADVDGHIGWQAVGLAPRRKKGDGLLPVPGDGRFDWDGYRPFADLPHLVDPPRGWFASANQNNLPPGYPFAIGYEWTDPFRFARIEEVLGTGRRVTLMDMMLLQQDELAMPARSLVPLLRGLNPGPGMTSYALDQLVSWNFVLSRDSVPAAIYVAWERALKKAVGDLVIPEEARSLVAESSLSTEKLIGWLTAPDGRFGTDPIAGRDAILLKALDQGLADLSRRLGPNKDHWHYGQAAFKHVSLKHPLSDAVNAELREKLDLGPLPRGGYGHTVNSTSDGDNQSAGATFRIIADTGDWDRSLGTNAPAQSGDPDSSHYGDLFQPWADGRYFPVFFGRPKVESVTEKKLTLVP
jgi:penicillin amidase